MVHKDSTTSPQKSGLWGKWIEYLKYRGEWLEDKRGSIMLVATVASTMTFQAAVNPPGGVWQQNISTAIDGFDCSETNICIAGTSVYARRAMRFYTYFIVYDTVSFLASIGVILLLISGVPLKNKLYVFVLTAAMIIAAASLLPTFLLSIDMVAPYDHRGRLFVLQCISGSTWYALLGFILVAHLIRFLSWVLNKFKCHQHPTSTTFV